MLQIPTYYYLNHLIEKVMAPPVTAVTVRTLKTTIPGSALESMQISYAKDYIAYKENGVLKVYNLIQEKQVFSKTAPSNDKNLGVLYFQWLPDRNTLIYFYARKNPNPMTTEVVPVTPTPSSTNSTQSSSSNTSTKKSSTSINQPQTSQTSKGNTALTQSTPSTQATNPDSIKTEDPQQAPATNSTPAPKQRIITHYNNPQITDLYTLELPDSDETTAPDDRFNESINGFPASGQITNMVVSTFTNLMYLTIKNGTNLQLMEIDVMKNVRTLNQSGEVITEMAASDKFGTLYIESKTGNSKIIQALEGTKRQTISKDETETILGNRAGTLYLGQIEGNNLVQVRSAADTSDSSKIEFKTVWQGSIPFKDVKVVIGTNNQIVISSNQMAYIIQSDGQQKQVTLTGKDNFVSQDGAELIELTPNGNSTDIELKPLQ